MAMVRRRADEHRMGVPSRVLGNFSIAAQITVVVGLPLGGILAGAFGWRALFFVNVPLALLVLTFTLLGVEKDPPRERGGLRSLLVSVDLPGVGLFAATVVSLLIFLSSLSSPIWWLLPVIVLAAGGLLLWERRASRPLLDVRMLARNGPLQRTYLRQTLSALVSYATLYGVSQWMEQSAGYSATQVGLILLPLSGVSIVLARIVSNRGWVRSPLLLGALAIAAAAALLLLMDARSSVWLLLLMAALLGVANGLTGFANQATLYVQSPPEEIAVASGLYRTFAYMGAIFSSSLIGITFGEAATGAGLHTLAWVMAAIGMALLVVTAADRRIPRGTAGERG
jgi:predicted MFS family arabinose efflux permease